MITTNGVVHEADSNKGFSMGRLTAPDSLELNYLEEGNNTKAVAMHLSRQHG
jgi:hypothetical protein